jgi:nucleotide-binding universal stress UspA family protein
MEVRRGGIASGRFRCVAAAGLGEEDEGWASGSAAAGADDVDQTLDALANRILDNACKRAKSIGVRRIKRQSETGDAAAAILDAARRKRIDFLVVGRHGFGPLTGWLLGSVSQKIISLAPCKVIVVP